MAAKRSTDYQLHRQQNKSKTVLASELVKGRVLQPNEVILVDNCDPQTSYTRLSTEQSFKDSEKGDKWFVIT
jgi:hypothetical protein